MTMFGVTGCYGAQDGDGGLLTGRRASRRTTAAQVVDRAVAAVAARVMTAIITIVAVAPPAAAQAAAPAADGATASPAATAPARLDLRPGDLRRFVPAETLYAPWTLELDEVVIRPRREPPDLPERRAVPQGLGGLWWAAQRPTQAWRLFVPDPNAAAVLPRSPDDPQPPPGSWRMRLDQSGKVW
jgi:hypothetical protein